MGLHNLDKILFSFSLAQPFSCFRKMISYKICVSGKFEHLIRTCQERMLTIPTATREKINEFYDLKFATKEMITNLGFSAIETVLANQLDFKMKLIIRDGGGFFCGFAFNCWEDPDQLKYVHEWRMLQVILIKTTDPSAKVPARFTGLLNLSLNTSYLQKGLEEKGQGVTWFSYMTKLPVWATERDVLSAELSLPGWVDMEAFKRIKERIMQHNKEIRLADQSGQTAERERKWPLFEPDDAKVVQLSLYNKELGEFKTMTLEEVTNKKIVMKEEAKHSEHRMNETSGLPDLGGVTRHNVHSRNDTYVHNDNRGSERSRNETSVHHNNRESERSRIETAVNQVIDNMNKLGVRNMDGNIVPADCVGEIRNNERIRKEQFDHSDNNRNTQQGGRNKDERVVPL